MFLVVFAVLVSIVVHDSHGFARAVDAIHEGGGGGGRQRRPGPREGGGGRRRAGGNQVDEYDSGRSTLFMSADAVAADDGEGTASMGSSVGVRKEGGGQDTGDSHGRERGEGGRGGRAPGRRIRQRAGGPPLPSCPRRGGEGEVRRREKGQAALLYP